MEAEFWRFDHMDAFGACFFDAMNFRARFYFEMEFSNTFVRPYVLSSREYT